jgi:hypothetical protein
MVRLKKDGSYDLRTKEGKMLQSWDEAKGIYGVCLMSLFTLIINLIKLPFALIGKIFGR